MTNFHILLIVFSTFAVLVDCKTVHGVLSSRLARLDQGQYITKFCFYGDALVRFHLNTTSTGKLYFYVDEKWSQVEQTSQCQNKLDLAQYSFGLESTSGENKFSPWTDPKLWHLLYADSVTCDSSVAALEDITFTLEMYNPDSEGKPTSHCGCDETGLLPFYEVLAFIYFAGVIAYGQRLWQTIEKGGPMHLMIKMLSVATVYQAIGHFLAVIHLYRYSKNGEGYPFLQLLSIVLDGLAEYQMLLMMAKLSTGWTLSSSFSTLDPKQMKQISVCVVTISVLQVMLLFWGTGLLQALVKIVIAGAFGLNISKKITEERSTLRKEFYIKFAKCSFTRVLAYPTLAIISFVLPMHTRFKVGPQYLYSLFRSLVSMTTVGTGKKVTPNSTMSLVFCIFTYLCGVLIFATIVGNAADMIVDLRRHREKYHKKLDGMKEYIAANQLPMDLQRRVIQWFDFAWRYKKDMSEEELFQQLNDNFRAEIAIHVNMDTLKKVKMFEHCDPGFLRELVLKLKPMLCSPGDHVCRQDEIGREMYIVNNGELEVLDKSGAVLAKLSAGRHFGEISILDMKGIGNRRTASVRSVGFSDLFRLSKKDLEEVIEYYPEEKDKLAKIARQTYENQRRERLNQKIKVEERDDSSLDKNDPRRWLTADKETLQRRLSLIEAKNDVKCIANKFRREHGHEINPREIVATLAQRVRMERSDEESRLIVKDFLAQKTRNKLPKGSTVSHDSFMATCDELTRDTCTKELVAPFLENCAIDHLRKSQRKFFSRPRSRTQDSSPYSSISSDIPLFTFTTNECGYNEQAESSHKERHAELHDGAFTIKLNNITVQNVKAPSFKKGILKQSNRQIMRWRTCNSAENLSRNESGVSDAEDPIPNHTNKEENHKIKFKDKLRAHFSKDKKKETRIILATPENSEIVEDSPKFQRAADSIIPTEHDPIKEINKELHCIGDPDKKCTCQVEELELEKAASSVALTTDASEKQTDVTVAVGDSMFVAGGNVEEKAST